MGNAYSMKNFKYATPVSEGTADSTPTYRAASHPDELIEELSDYVYKNGFDLFKRSVDRYPDRPWLGRRFRNESGESGPYEWITYSEGCAISLSLGATLLNPEEELAPLIEFPDEGYLFGQKLRLLGLFSKNCVEWFLAEQACNASGVALVPLYDTLGVDAMAFILKQTRLRCSLVGFDCLPTLVKALTAQALVVEKAASTMSDPDDLDKASTMSGGGNGDSEREFQTGNGAGPARFALRTIILVDPPNPRNMTEVMQKYKEAVETCKPLGVKVYMWHEVCAMGKKNPVKPQPVSLNSVNTLCYTSGTTGDPKGVLITHRNVVSLVCAAMRGPVSTSGHYIGPAEVHISYLPLAHVLERLVTNAVSALGAATGIYSGDMARLLDDIRVLSPTIFVSVPRLFGRISDKIAGNLVEKRAPVQMLFNQGLNSKINRHKVDGSTSHKLWDSIVFNKIKAMMGGRMRGMICGGAPLDPMIQDKMAAFFCCPVMQGYGLTETFGPAFMMHPSDPESGHVGGLFPACEFKLMSVPELEYFVTDTPPRGELCLRGPSVSVGYFRNPQETASAFDSDGWFHTGDIACILPSTLAVKIIDRKKNIFKLAQGEYVAPEKIEGIYQQALSVSQCFIFGYSQKTSLMAIVVPDEDSAKRWAEKAGLRGNFKEICANPLFQEFVEKDMEEAGKKLELKGFEKARRVVLVTEEFSVENGLLTPTVKIKRQAAQRKYQHVIDEVYSTLQ